MRICIIHPKACTESAQELAKAIGADCITPREYQDLTHRYYKVFNYGCGWVMNHKSLINQPDAINNCIDKRKTFKLLKKHNIPIPVYATRPQDVKPDWGVAVCRNTATGSKNEGMTYHYFDGEKLPKCELYTKLFPTEWEYRIVVFMGKVVGRYRKDKKGNSWEFTKMMKQGFEDVDRSCLQAAGALQIDYVGFDVLEAKDGSYVLLEANSGPVLTEEAKQAIKKYFKELK